MQIVPVAGDAPSFDDEDFWLDITEPGKVKAEAVASVTRWKGKRARGFLLFRGKAADWIRSAQYPRFRIQLGGPAANYIRIVPDAVSGKEPIVTRHGDSLRFSLGTVTAWPDEIRAHTQASWHVHHGYMVLELPLTWARPTEKVMSTLSPPMRAETTPHMDAQLKNNAVHIVQSEPLPRGEHENLVPPTVSGIALTPSERIVFGLLLTRSLVVSRAFMKATAKGPEDDRNPKIVDTWIFNLRSKLGAMVTIVTESGGYSIPQAQREAFLKVFKSGRGA